MSTPYLSLNIVYPGEFYAVTYIGMAEQPPSLIKIIPLPCLNNQYSCSRDGSIYHLSNGRWKKHISYTDKGYYVVAVPVDGQLKRFRAHRLIALTYLPNPKNKPQVDHINRIRHDNSVENLRWVTSLQNNYNKSMFLVHDKSVPAKYQQTYSSCVRHINSVIAEYYRLCPPEG